MNAIERGNGHRRPAAPTAGLHHVTAVCSEASRVVAFYETVLGQRLVKRTVNFDDPGTYHLYFADEVGTPGTVLTFFAFPGGRRGAPGNGEVGRVSYAVGEASLGYWRDRLRRLGVTVGAVQERFGREGVAFTDPDGMALELVAAPEAAAGRPWPGADVPPEHALRGFFGVTLWVGDAAPTATLLTSQLGFARQDEAAGELRFAVPDSVSGGVVDVRVRPDGGPGRPGAGSVHHVAFRAADDAHQAAMRDALLAAGRYVTPVRDRHYFRSVYFREPGGTLFELATDGPGFTVDEPVETLGAALRLPPWLEARRDEVEALLPSLERAAGG